MLLHENYIIKIYIFFFVLSFFFFRFKEFNYILKLLFIYKINKYFKNKQPSYLFLSSIFYRTKPASAIMMMVLVVDSRTI
jgi:hypothetical protein